MRCFVRITGMRDGCGCVSRDCSDSRTPDAWTGSHTSLGGRPTNGVNGHGVYTLAPGWRLASVSTCASGGSCERLCQGYAVRPQAASMSQQPLPYYITLFTGNIHRCHAARSAAQTPGLAQTIHFPAPSCCSHHERPESLWPCNPTIVCDV
eukprot:3776198-Prymnesium_polylepis.2